jgi:hypothetical protein
LQNCLKHVPAVIAVERTLARQHLVDDNRERPDVRATVDRPAAGLFRTHIGGRADQGLRIGDGSIVHSSDAEIEDLRGSVRKDHDIRGLDVAVDDSRRVGVLESPRDLQCNRERFVEGESTALQSRLKRFTVVERHGNEQLPVRGLADLVDRAHVRMIESGRGARLRHESGRGAGIRIEVRGEEFQGDLTPEPLVSCSVDHCHAARADGFVHHVLSDSTSGPFRGGVSHPRAGWLQEGCQPVHHAVSFVGHQERLDFLPEGRVGGAAEVEQRGALRRGAVDSVGEDVLNALPAIRRERIAGGRRPCHPCSSRFSHARAAAHSLLTVAGDTFSASALSSTVIPP